MSAPAKPLGKMTPAERKAVLAAACAKMKRELESPQMRAAMAKAIDEAVAVENTKAQS